MMFKKILYHLFIEPFVSMYNTFRISFKESKKELDTKLCRHDWIYWDGKFKCEDDKTIDGTIIHNMYRKCTKCGLKHRKDLTPSFHGSKSKYWHRETKKFPNNSSEVELEVFVYGASMSQSRRKQKIRNSKINKVLK